ncbi:protoheme IX synthesis protein [Bordetella pertussis]|nr:protoheme IX synthesis protein [Bordetella pertussis]
MRTWFWTLLLAVVAVALAVVLRAHAGNVLLLVWPWRIELSLTLTVLLLVAAFVTLYVGLRLLAWLVAIPDRLRAWRGRRAQERDHELLERGWIGLLEGRFAQAEKDLSKLFDQTKVRSSRVLAALSGARAAHNLGEYERRDRMLESAREQAGEDAGLQEATATVSADMLLDQGRAQQALDLLEPLQDGGARHLHTMRLLLRAETALQHHERVFMLARGLLRRNAIGKAEAEQLIDSAGAARLRAGMAVDQWRPIWKDLKSDERLLPNIALAGAAAFEDAGEANEAARILEAAVAVKFNPALVAAYARCDAAQVPHRLAKAETWLQQRPADTDLLTALGLLCLNGQLWRQAERYLQRSVSRRNDPQAHALLGSLYDRLDRPADAARHWRQATAARVALPVLVADIAYVGIHRARHRRGAARSRAGRCRLRARSGCARSGRARARVRRRARTRQRAAAHRHRYRRLLRQRAHSGGRHRSAGLELSRRRGRRATGQARRRRIIRRPGVRRQSLISFSSRQGQS